MARRARKSNQAPRKSGPLPQAPSPPSSSGTARADSCAVAVISLGCAKNLVDTEVMCGALAETGFLLTPDPEQADVLLINTCCFIAAARTEAEAEIRQGLDWKRQRRGRMLVVSGCLAQRQAAALPRQFPDIDLLIGLDDIARLPDLLRDQRARLEQPAVSPRCDSAPSYLYDHGTARLQLTPPNFAYVKIAEGCDHHCSFCTIPAIRGRQRSRDIASVTAECRQFLAQGVRELNLIAQDTSRYGADRGDGSDLQQLLRACDRIEGDYWLRLLYLHPRHTSPALLETCAKAHHVVPYIDLPLQHICNRILRAMGRRLDERATRQLMQRLRLIWPHAAVRTTLLVGFPGETNADFDALLEFVGEYRFERLGVFVFSPEEGTRAAALRDGLVAPELALERRARLLERQQQIALEQNRALVGRTVRVLVERREARRDFVGRTAADAPDVDNLVHFQGADDCLRRGFVTVRIDTAAPYDLHGTTVAAEQAPS